MIVNWAIFLVFVAMAAVMIFFLWQTLIAPKEDHSTKHHQEVSQSDQQNRNENLVGGGALPRGPNPTEEAIADYTKALAVFTAFLVLATLLLFVSGERNVDVARQTAEAANRSAKVAEDSLVKLQRAFINYNGLTYLSHKKDDDTVWWSMRFNWINSGASPARKVRFFVGRYFEDADLPVDYPFAVSGDVPEIFMGPRGQMTTAKWFVTAEDLIAVREGKKFLYFWGRADYRDIFDDARDHVTKFSIRIVDFRGDPAKYWDDKTNIVELIPDTTPSRHNCADEDCQTK